MERETEINIKNLTKLINHLKRTHPRNFNMRTWISFAYNKDWNEKPAIELVDRIEKVGDCGTRACIAGHAALLAAAEENKSSQYYAGWWAKRKAKEWLGLQYEEAEELFQPEDPDEGLVIPYDLDRAITVLEHLKNTAEMGCPEVNWEAK